MLHSDGTWAVPIDDLICQFVSSPIALLPIHRYMRRDNYSQQAMQWILSEESKMQRVDKNFKIRHAKSFLGEKCVTYRDEFGRYYTINQMDILWILKEINMQWNLMDVGITDVHDVTLMIENHYRLWERHCNNDT